jgi:8-oxo-dGTP pyrophosphatase MutT (NUDIX family)
LIEERLKDTRPAVDARMAYPQGLGAEVDAALRQYFPASPVAAAVLVPIVDHPSGLSVLLTQRATHLKNHPGQISFPGGRIEAKDGGPMEAALRETEEEIGLSRERVEVIGFLPDHAVISGFRVTPVVGLVRAGFELRLDPEEVAGTFEAPLRHLLDPATHTRSRRSIAGQEIETFELPWGSFNIWGATAGMLLTLREALGVPVPDGD